MTSFEDTHQSQESTRAGATKPEKVFFIYLFVLLRFLFVWLFHLLIFFFFAGDITDLPLSTNSSFYDYYLTVSERVKLNGKILSRSLTVIKWSTRVQ